MNQGEIIVSLKLENGKFTAGIKTAEGDLEKFTKKANEDTDKVESKFGKAFTSIAKKATKAFAVVSAAAAAALTAAVGKYVIGGGISRALNIEDAQAKLKGLGHDVKGVEKIMESALASVKGTAYGLDAAATAAAGAVAAGIEPGKELTRYLSLAGDAATIAGVSFDEMGSIFGKVQTNQKAYTQELNQLADRGIPIYQWLQEELGVSAEALRDMVSKGEVDSETYFKVIEKNIGGAALESGKTTRGAWANMQAAMARVGAAIAEDIIPKVRKAFGNMTKWFDDNSDTIVEAVDTAMDTLADFGKKAFEVGKQVADYLAPKLQSLWRVINDRLLPALVDLWKNVIEPLLPVIGVALVIAIGAVVDIATILVEAMAFLIEEFNKGNPVVVGLASVFGGLAIAMAFSKVFSAMNNGFALMRNTTIPKTIKSVKALRLLISSPIGFGAIAIGAALIALQQVQKAAEAARAAIDQATAMNQTDLDASKGLIEVAKRQRAAGKISEKEYRRLIGVAAMNSGGPVRAGMPYLVGDNPDGSINRTTELFIPDTSGYIMNSGDLREALFGGSKDSERGSATKVLQTNNIYTQVDLDVVNRSLARAVNR